LGKGLIKSIEKQTGEKINIVPVIKVQEEEAGGQEKGEQQ